MCDFLSKLEDICNNVRFLFKELTLLKRKVSELEKLLILIVKSEEINEAKLSKNIHSEGVED